MPWMESKYAIISHVVITCFFNNCYQGVYLTTAPVLHPDSTIIRSNEIDQISSHSIT